jgi:hypothetical protein
VFNIFLYFAILFPIIYHGTLVLLLGNSAFFHYIYLPLLIGGGIFLWQMFRLSQFFIDHFTEPMEEYRVWCDKYFESESHIIYRSFMRMSWEAVSARFLELPELSVLDSEVKGETLLGAWVPTHGPPYPRPKQICLVLLSRVRAKCSPKSGMMLFRLIAQ